MWTVDLRPVIRLACPADRVTALLCERPVPLSFGIVRALAAAAKAWASSKISGFRTVPKRPSAVSIEITNACNLRCKMCNFIRMERAPRLMEFDVFKTAVHKCREAGVRSVRLHSYGETLLHPQLGPMIKYASDAGLQVWISTNGQLLNEERAREILRSGLSCLRYSIEGATQATYESVRARGKWHKLVENMRRFKDLRDELSPATRIGLNTVLMKETAADIRLMQESFSAFVDEIAISPLEMLGDKGEELAGPSRLEEAPDWSARTPCRLLWELMSITADGKVNLCCADVEASHVVGDILTQSVEDIWTGPALSGVRNKHRAGKLEDEALCRRCSFGVTNSNANRLRYSLLTAGQVRFELR